MDFILALFHLIVHTAHMLVDLTFIVILVGMFFGLVNVTITVRGKEWKF